MHFELKDKDVYVLGDTHDLDFASILYHYKLKNFVLICVGDHGEGYEHEEVSKYFIKKIDDYCQKNKGLVLIIRGNHSDPAFFTKDSKFSSDLVKFLPDYSTANINDKNYLFVGGATSIDRLWSIEKGEKKNKTLWWAGEKFVPKDSYDDYQNTDVLITHSAPRDAFFDDMSRIAWRFERDTALKEELIQERQELNRLFYSVKPKFNFFGHFHESIINYHEGEFKSVFRGLDISEIFLFDRGAMRANIF